MIITFIIFHLSVNNRCFADLVRHFFLQDISALLNDNLKKKKRTLKNKKNTDDKEKRLIKCNYNGLNAVNTIKINTAKAPATRKIADHEHI